MKPYKKLYELNIPLDKGDEILVGKFRNRKAIVTGLDIDENNQPIIKTTKGDKKLPFRISKLMPKQ